MPTYIDQKTKPKVAVVTGASAGVGRATVREFARRGMHVGLIARGRDGLEGAKEDVEALGGQAHIAQADVADYEQVERAAASIEEAFGPIDLWVNNAMTTVFSPVQEMKPEEYRRVTEVTYLGAVHGSLVALERFREHDAGKIIQVGSALAFRGIPLQSAYSASKHAIAGFTESLTTELMHEGSDITVTSVHLPGMNTPQFEWGKSRMPRQAQPVPPIFEPEVAAEAIAWAAEHDRRRMYVGAATLKTVWGNRVASDLVDHYLARTGYDGQQIDTPRDPERPDNLWEPVSGDFGARGPYSDRANDRSMQLAASKHRGWLVGAAAVAFAGGIMWGITSDDSRGSFSD